MNPDLMLCLMFVFGVAYGLWHGWSWREFWDLRKARKAAEASAAKREAVICLSVELAEDWTREDVSAALGHEDVKQFIGQQIRSLAAARRIIQEAHAKHSEAA